jgi:hypothetical protein
MKKLFGHLVSNPATSKEVLIAALFNANPVAANVVSEVAPVTPKVF